MTIEIGSGANGRVYYDITTGYCIKQSRRGDRGFIKEAEAQMLAATLGIAPQVISYTEDYIEMEYIDGLTVCEYRYKENLYYAFDEEIKEYIKALQAIGIKYEDNHDENFMVDKNGKLWIIDFGDVSYCK